MQNACPKGLQRPRKMDFGCNVRPEGRSGSQLSPQIASGPSGRRRKALLKRGLFLLSRRQITSTPRLHVTPALVSSGRKPRSNFHRAALRAGASSGMPSAHRLRTTLRSISKTFGESPSVIRGHTQCLRKESFALALSAEWQESDQPGGQLLALRVQCLSF